jgi:hypothetical protein
MASAGCRMLLRPPLTSLSLGGYLRSSPSSLFPLCSRFASTRAWAPLSSSPLERHRTAAIAGPRHRSIFHAGQLIFVVLEWWEALRDPSLSSSCTAAPAPARRRAPRRPFLVSAAMDVQAAPFTPWVCAR